MSVYVGPVGTREDDDSCLPVPPVHPANLPVPPVCPNGGTVYRVVDRQEEQ